MYSVVHITTDLGLAGRERVVVELANRQAQSGYAVAIVCLKKEGKLKERLHPAIDVFTCWKGARIEFKTFGKIAAFLKQKKPQIVHTHNPGTLLYGNLGARIAKIPIIINTEHGFSEPANFRTRIKEALLYRLTRKVTVVSESLRQRIKATYWVSDHKLALVPNGISTPALSKKNLDLRSEIGIAATQYKIGIVGRLSTVKNHQYLLQAFSQAVNENHDLRLWIIGVGPLQGQLENQGRRLNISDKIQFLGLRDDVPDILSLLDTLVLCSLSEGMSIAILEAMALGVPTIATDVGGNGELIENGVSGILVPLNDIPALKNAILLYAGDENLRSLHAKNAQKRFCHQFSTVRMHRRFERLYSKILSDAGGLS